MRMIYDSPEVEAAYTKLSEEYTDLTKRLEKAKTETHHATLLLVLEVLEFLLDNVEIRKLHR